MWDLLLYEKRLSKNSRFRKTFKKNRKEKL